MAKANKMPITERALMQRINRKLKPDNEQLRTSRTEMARQANGQYYIVNYGRNTIVNNKLDIEALGKKLGVLYPHEELIAE